MTYADGLLQRDWEFIHKAMAQCSEIERAVLFGSRAMGNFRSGSDVDLAVYGTSVTSATLNQLDALLNEHLLIKSRKWCRSKWGHVLKSIPNKRLVSR